MSWFPTPITIEAEEWSRLPDRFRDDRPTEWSIANRYDGIDSFLEGPSFDRDGRLLVTDIPNGRVFHIDSKKSWTEIVRFDGWPNGLKIGQDGQTLIADRKLGLIALDTEHGKVRPVLSSMRTEAFKGLNDLHISNCGDIYFTDQGQTGLQDPSGRVYRLRKSGELDCLISTGVSPNGIVVSADEEHFFVAMTRSSQIWRIPSSTDGITTKACLFCQLPGGVSGPDGLAMDTEGGVYVCHLGHGGVWRLDKWGVPTHRIVWNEARLMTNLAFGGEDNRDLYITESATGTILRCRSPYPGQVLASHLPEPK